MYGSLLRVEGSPKAKNNLKLANNAKILPKHHIKGQGDLGKCTLSILFNHKLPCNIYI